MDVAIVSSSDRACSLTAFTSSSSVTFLAIGPPSWWWTIASSMPPMTRSIAAGLPAGALDFSRSHEMPWQESVLRELTPTVTRVLTQSCGGAVDPRALLELPEPLVEVPELALDPVLAPLPRPRH